jgi:hypothetical protein
VITITSNEDITVRVRLNPSNVNGSAITLVLDSPSRPQLSFDSVITTINEGYYSFPLTESDTSQLVDDTYFYTLTQAGVTLKKGDVQFIANGSADNQFDYTLDFAMA